jgi:SpoVK/Ycf46/Vps4 family AAA+-type ATPase
MNRILEQLKRDINKLEKEEITLDEVVKKLKRQPIYRRTGENILKSNIKKVLPYCLEGPRIIDVIQEDHSKTKLGKRSSSEIISNGKSSAETQEEIFFEEDSHPLQISSIGGHFLAKKKLTDFININIKQRDHLNKLCFGQASKNLLIVGPNGSGKSSLIKVLITESSLPHKKINLLELFSGVTGVAEAKLRKIFDEANEKGPCILVLEDLDKLGDLDKISSPGAKLMRQIFLSLDKSNVFVIGSISEVEKLPKMFFSSGKFDSHIELRIPNDEERLEIVQIIFKMDDPDYNSVICKEINKSELVERTAGFVPTDFINLLKKSAECAIKEGQIQIKEKHIIQAMSQIKPLMKQEGFSSIPSVQWSDVGALDDIKHQLELLIIKPLQNKERCKLFGIKRTAGILLHGPPGCGKTMLAKAVANLTKCNFIYVKGPELLSMYVGESEKAVRGLFARARLSSPCISKSISFVS